MSPFMDEMRQRAKVQRQSETDPVKRLAYGLAERAGYDWFDTESQARRAFEHAAAEMQPMYAALYKLAEFDDAGANEYLKATGSYSRFDEPASVKVAREVLQNMGIVS